MHELYRCLELGKVGIFESPTGTVSRNRLLRHEKSLEYKIYSAFKSTKYAIMNTFRKIIFLFSIICKNRIKLCFHNKSVHYS